MSVFEEPDEPGVLPWKKDGKGGVLVDYDDHGGGASKDADGNPRSVVASVRPSGDTWIWSVTESDFASVQTFESEDQATSVQIFKSEGQTTSSVDARYAAEHIAHLLTGQRDEGNPERELYYGLGNLVLSAIRKLTPGQVRAIMDQFLMEHAKDAKLPPIPPTPTEHRFLAFR